MARRGGRKRTRNPSGSAEPRQVAGGRPDRARSATMAAGSDANAASAGASVSATDLVPPTSRSTHEGLRRWAGAGRMSDSECPAVGWPRECEIGYGGALRLVPGFMVFELSEPHSSATHQADKRGDVRPAAVGWPRVDSVDPTVGALDAPPPPAGPQASPEGATASGCGADPFRSGRDKTVHQYGSDLDGGPGNRNAVSRETGPFAGPDHSAGADV